MHRRTLLSSLAATTAALAGCATRSGDGPETTTTGDRTTDRTTATTTSDGELPVIEAGAASVVELETGPRTYAFSPTAIHAEDGVRVRLAFDRTATSEHPARLVGWLENGYDYANTVEVQWIPVVGRTYGRQPRGYDHEARLHFAPTENNDLAENVPDVVRDETGFWRVEDVGPWMTERRRFEAGERVRLEYVLVGEPGMPGRPTGQYEFRGRDAQTRVSVWDTTSPGPDADSQFAGRSVPAFSEDSSTQWFHVSDESTAAYLQPARERAELDAAVDFEFVNHSHESAQCGHWNLHKLVDGQWFHIAPRMHTDDCRMVAAGGRKEWSLRAFNADPVPCDGSGGGCAGGLTRGFLGGGEYAVVAGYGHPANQSAALVELVGDPVDVVHTEDAAVEVDGDTATVTLDRFGDGERPPDSSFHLERASGADERLLPEQVMGGGGIRSRGLGLRNALAAMDEGIDRVVVRADEHVVDGALGYDEDSRRFELRGQAYQAVRADDEE
jgi:hypothetical protein